jgi:D-arabinose 1-dehydrogenase-like Zn-dependent alcohol dehydrogenase
LKLQHYTTPLIDLLFILFVFYSLCHKLHYSGPLLCAGVTTYNSIRHANLKPGAWLAVQGIGGLGHLGVQFARAMGYRVIVLSTSADKEKFARELGAHEYVDTSKQEVVSTIMKLTGGNGVGLIVSTTPSGKAMASVVNALGPNGKLLTLGAGPEPITVHSGQLIANNRSVQGWASGSPNDSEETLEFAHAFNIRVLTESFPLEKAAEVYNAMNENKLRFRGVLLPGKKA